MIEFDLARALAGDALIDRNGNDVTGFEADSVTVQGYGFSAKDSEGKYLSFTDSGKYWNYKSKDYRDLFMKFKSTEHTANLTDGKDKVTNAEITNPSNQLIVAHKCNAEDLDCVVVNGVYFYPAGTAL